MSILDVEKVKKELDSYDADNSGTIDRVRNCPGKGPDCMRWAGGIQYLHSERIWC